MTLLHNINRSLQRRRNSTWHALGYDTTIRAETPADYEAIASLTRSAFNSEAEVCLISTLRQQTADYIALVAEQQGKIVGHILFSAATVKQAPHTRLMALAPTAVSNVLQKQGIGSALLRAGLEQCQQRGIEAVVVLGHPVYYPRFAFVPASRFNISPPWPVPDNAFMLLELTPGALKGKSGEIQYHPAFAALL